jgi:hypothetical protein
MQLHMLCIIKKFLMQLFFQFHLTRVIEFFNFLLMLLSYLRVQSLWIETLNILNSAPCSIFNP